MKKTLYILGLLSTFVPFFTFSGCHNNEGLIGRSKTKEEAHSNGSDVLEYMPDKRVVQLFDGTKVKIENAWTETSFTYKAGKKMLNPEYGSHFVIPFHSVKQDISSFTFSIADSTNIIFTSGIEENICYLNPRTLLHRMKIIFIQKNPDVLKGWTEPIVTDTITFTRIKSK